jgi:putative lipoprotein
MRIAAIVGTCAITAFGALPVFAADQVLSGSILKKDRMALPATAIIDVRLLDVSKMDVAATQIAAKRMALAGQVPLAYELVYDEAVIDERMSYAVQAEIIIDGQTLYRNTTMTPALTRGAGQSVDVMVEQISMTDEVSADDLSGEWVVKGFGGPILIVERPPTVKFEADGNVACFSGCNRFYGTYSRTGSALSFGNAAMTQMACPDPYGKLEQTFQQSMSKVATYEITGAGLLLRDGAGQIVMQLVRPI